MASFKKRRSRTLSDEAIASLCNGPPSENAHQSLLSFTLSDGIEEELEDIAFNTLPDSILPPTSPSHSSPSSSFSGGTPTSLSALTSLGLSSKAVSLSSSRPSSWFQGSSNGSDISSDDDDGEVVAARPVKYVGDDLM